MFDQSEYSPDPFSHPVFSTEFVGWSPLFATQDGSRFDHPSGSIIDPNSLHSNVDGDSTTSSWTPRSSSDAFHPSPSLEGDHTRTNFGAWTGPPAEHYSISSNNYMSGPTFTEGGYFAEPSFMHVPAPTFAPQPTRLQGPLGLTPQQDATRYTNFTHVQPAAQDNDRDPSVESSDQDDDEDMAVDQDDDEESAENTKTRRKTSYDGATFACHQCKVGFSRKSNQDTHHRDKHEGRTKDSFKCLRCDKKKFGRETDLKRHFFNVHMKKKIKCDECSVLISARADSLQRHLETHQTSPQAASRRAKKLVKQEQEACSQEIRAMIQKDSQRILATRTAPPRDTPLGLPSQVASTLAREQPRALQANVATRPRMAGPPPQFFSGPFNNQGMRPGQRGNAQY